MAFAKGIVTKVKHVVTEFFSPEKVSKSPARLAAGKKATAVIAVTSSPGPTDWRVKSRLSDSVGMPFERPTHPGP